MNLKRLRLGELVALTGLVGLFVCLFFEWFTPDTKQLSNTTGINLEPDARAQVAGRASAFADQLAQTGWSALGWFALILLAAAMLVVLAWLVATLTQPSPALPVALLVWSAVAGFVLVLVVAQLVAFAPDLGYGVDADLRPAGWLGLLFSLLIAGGAFVALKDERTGAAESQPGDIEIRAVPR